jgi:HTH-type transcriptional regulator, competence development regulator
MSFGKRVLELRRQNKLTQRELAARLEIDFTYVSKIENDSLPNPPSELLIRKMAKELSADAEELLDLAGKFDQHTLQNIVAEMPEAGILLRRLQNRQISKDQIKHFLEQSKDNTK